jgi:pentatricopeptide repeat protein
LKFDNIYIFEEYKILLKPGHDAVVIWTAIIQAYSIHGLGHETLQLFACMQQQNIKPSAITFICVLTGCSHAGLVEQAWNIYSSMEEQYNITPAEPHQACMVDVWGRAGMLEQAEKFINNLPRQHVSLWQTLLGASRNHGNIHFAQKAAFQILQLEPRDSSTYILLANTHAATGNWKEHTSVWSEMLNQNIKKIPGITWVTINGKTENFYVDSWDHPYLLS